MMRSFLAAVLFLQSVPGFAQTVVREVPSSAAVPGLAVGASPGASAGSSLQRSGAAELSAGGLPSLNPLPSTAAGAKARAAQAASSSVAVPVPVRPAASAVEAPGVRPAAPALETPAPSALPGAEAAGAPSAELGLAASAGVEGAVRSVRESLGAEGREGSAHERLRAQFDGAGLHAPAPVAADAPQGEHAPAVPGLSETVVFNGRRFPPAQFTDEGAGRMSAKLIEALDATKETMELSLLEVIHQELMEAVLRAKERGVKVRIVVDASHMYPSKPGTTRSRELQAFVDAGIDIRVLRGGKEHGLMHNKFALLDKTLVWSGSANWSRAADKLHQENVTYTAAPHRAKGFQDAFDWMWDLGRPVGEEAGTARGTAPSDPTRPVDFNGTKLPAYVFAPGDATEEWLLKAISAARVSLDVAMFSCTSQRLREALLAAQKRGVKVRIVFDAVQYSHLPPMAWFLENGFDVRIAVGLVPEKGAMHNKFVVFDGKMVQTGSYNWTENAKYNNFENAQFFADPSLAAAYAAYFERVRSRGRQATAADAAPERPAAVPAGTEPARPALAPDRRSGTGRHDGPERRQGDRRQGRDRRGR